LPGIPRVADRARQAGESSALPILVMTLPIHDIHDINDSILSRCRVWHLGRLALLKERKPSGTR
jgi:hypothetical protein